METRSKGKTKKQLPNQEKEEDDEIKKSPVKRKTKEVEDPDYGEVSNDREADSSQVSRTVTGLSPAEWHELDRKFGERSSE